MSRKRPCGDVMDELFQRLTKLGVPNEYRVSRNEGTWWINYGDERSEAGLGSIRAMPIYLLGLKEWLTKQANVSGFRVQVGVGTKDEYSALIWPKKGSAFRGEGRTEFDALGSAAAEYAHAQKAPSQKPHLNGKRPQSTVDP